MHFHVNPILPTKAFIKLHDSQRPNLPPSILPRTLAQISSAPAQSITTGVTLPQTIPRPAGSLSWQNRLLVTRPNTFPYAAVLTLETRVARCRGDYLPGPVLV
jgi:hypothetical protein